VIKKFQSAVASLGEFGLISRITASIKNDSSIITGIGDDAAVIALSPGMQFLTSTDMLLEDVHFRLAWHDPFLLGRKSLAVSISDIAAMGAIPRWALLSLAIPSELSLDFIDNFMRGFLAMASENEITLIGGDTCSSRSGLIISVTIMGEQYPNLILRRSGAMADDDIWVTGTLGDAALGLKLVEAGGGDFSLSRLLDPTPRISAGLALAETGVVTSMIDISDGVMADYGHIAEQSAVGGRIYLEHLPLSSAFLSHSANFPAIPYPLALSGGEDYELCFTASSSNREKIASCMKKSGIQATRIGIVTGSLEVTAVNPNGSTYSAQLEGFNHFK
jgi:thiamine-monophosphate kinase